VLLRIALGGVSPPGKVPREGVGPPFVAIDEDATRRRGYGDESTYARCPFEKTEASIASVFDFNSKYLELTQFAKRYRK
jgi:hypothetical protein